MPQGPSSTGSVVVAHGLSCPEVCGSGPAQGSHPCPLGKFPGMVLNCEGICSNLGLLRYSHSKRDLWNVIKRRDQRDDRVCPPSPYSYTSKVRKVTWALDCLQSTFTLTISLILKTPAKEAWQMLLFLFNKWVHWGLGKLRESYTLQILELQPTFPKIVKVQKSQSPAEIKCLVLNILIRVKSIGIMLSWIHSLKNVFLSGSCVSAHARSRACGHTQDSPNTRRQETSRREVSWISHCSCCPGLPVPWTNLVHFCLRAFVLAVSHSWKTPQITKGLALLFRSLIKYYLREAFYDQRISS